jgi:hypothetical protein
VGNRLDPEEALAGPLYLVAALLIVIPSVDFLLTVPAAEFSSEQWRFNAIGLLSGYTLSPILGLALAFVVSSVQKRYTLQRVLVLASLITSVVLFTLSLGFLLDVTQVRATVRDDGRLAFNSAWNRAFIKLMLSAVAFAYIGWRARRMIPARSRHRAARPVHVVSK